LVFSHTAWFSHGCTQRLLSISVAKGGIECGAKVRRQGGCGALIIERRPRPAPARILTYFGPVLTKVLAIARVHVQGGIWQSIELCLTLSPFGLCSDDADQGLPIFLASFSYAHHDAILESNHTSERAPGCFLLGNGFLSLYFTHT
jgi:hypothetical protein